MTYLFLRRYSVKVMQDSTSAKELLDNYQSNYYETDPFLKHFIGLPKKGIKIEYESHFLTIS